MVQVEQQLRTVRQLAQELKPTGAFSEASLRWLIFNSASNGFERALVRMGRRVFIHRDRFGEWLEQQRGGKRAA
jgi:hypothetical protein